jgi:hypothetical protein
VFRQGEGLRKEEPVPVSEAEGHVGPPKGLAGGDDVQHGQLTDSVGVVEGQAVGAAGAAVVPGHSKPLEAELAHHLNLVAGHGPLGVRLVVRGCGRLAAPAVAAQVGGDHGELLRQPRRHGVPHHVGLRVPVEQQERRAAPAMADADHRLPGIDQRELEPIEHWLPPERPVAYTKRAR